MPSETKQRTVVRSEKGRWAAGAACVVGLLYAAVSLYWAAGGTWLLHTVGGSFARPGPANDATVIIAVWAAAVLKLAAALLPLLALRNPRRQPRVARLLAWIAAGTLIIYGAVLTIIGLLVQADVVHSPANTDWQALTWHAYLWDPLFLAWGALIATALLRSRSATPRRATRARDTSNQCESAPQAQQPGGGDANANTGTITKPAFTRG